MTIGIILRREIDGDGWRRDKSGLYGGRAVSRPEAIDQILYTSPKAFHPIGIKSRIAANDDKVIAQGM